MLDLQCNLNPFASCFLTVLAQKTLGLQDDFSKSILVLPLTQEISGPESNGLLKEFEMLPVLPGFGPWRKPGQVLVLWTDFLDRLAGHP